MLAERTFFQRWAIPHVRPSQAWKTFVGGRMHTNARLIGKDASRLHLSSIWTAHYGSQTGVPNMWHAPEAEKCFQPERCSLQLRTDSLRSPESLISPLVTVPKFRHGVPWMRLCVRWESCIQEDLIQSSNSAAVLTAEISPSSKTVITPACCVGKHFPRFGTSTRFEGKIRKPPRRFRREGFCNEPNPNLKETGQGFTMRLMPSPMAALNP